MKYKITGVTLSIVIMLSIIVSIRNVGAQQFPTPPFEWRIERHTQGSNLDLLSRRG
jgi:hypothetical protein